MGLTPDQIAGVIAQDSARTNQMANLIQLPQEMALRQAQLNAAQMKEPTIPVETPYGVIPMTTDQAMRVADQTANRALREDALALQRQNAAASAETRALMASIAGQNAQTARERLAETKTENLAKGEREKVEQQERSRNNILRHLETYTKNPNGSPDLLASSINDAPAEVFPEVMFTNSYGDSYTLDPSNLIAPDGKPVTKQYIDSVAKKKKVSPSTIVKELVKNNADAAVNPGFSENWSTISKPIKRGSYPFSSELK